MDLAEVVEIEDFSNETLLALAERLENSRTFQDLIMREVELDEVWRRVDTVLRNADEQGLDQQSIGTLEKLFTLVFEAHDLAGDDQPLEAAKKLRAAMSLQPGR